MDGNRFLKLRSPFLHRSQVWRLFLFYQLLRVEETDSRLFHAFHKLLMNLPSNRRVENKASVTEERKVYEAWRNLNKGIMNGTLSIFKPFTWETKQKKVELINLREFLKK